MVGPDDDGPGVIARPPRLYLGFFALGLALDFALPAPFLATSVQVALAVLLLVAGFATVIAAMRQFGKAGTNVQTPLPTTAIVTDGLYRLTRNPIYLGISLIYLGLGFAVDSLWIVALLIVVLVIVHFGVVVREERYLESKFGDAYRHYKETVRRWL